MFLRTVFGWLLTGLGLVALILTSIPQPRQVVEIPFVVDGVELGIVTLEHPASLRLGDKAVVKLRVDIESQQEPGLDLENAHLVSQLELMGIGIEPLGEIRAAVEPGSIYHVSWKILSQGAGESTGIVWLFYENGNQARQLVLGREITFQSSSVLGMSYPATRAISAVTTLLGVFLLFTLLLKSARQKPKKIVLRMMM